MVSARWPTRRRQYSQTPSAIRRFHHWLWRSSRAFARSRRSASSSTGSSNSLMRGERGRQLLPLAHEPHHLLLGVLTLRGRRAHALAVRVERRITESLADLREPGLERVNLPLDVLESPSQLPHLLRRPPGLLRPPPYARVVRRRGSGRCGAGSGASGVPKPRDPAPRLPPPRRARGLDRGPVG